MGQLATVDFQSWLAENRHFLKPPVGNKNIYNEGGFMVFVVGGPNERTDYHIDPLEELFYMIEGDMTLKIVEDGVFRDLTIRQGECFLLPPFVPHSPQRAAGTMGVVVEYMRPPDKLDTVLWYCPNCRAVVYEEQFHLTDATTLLNPVFDRFYDSLAARTCTDCGTVHPNPRD